MAGAQSGWFPCSLQPLSRHPQDAPLLYSSQMFCFQVGGVLLSPLLPGRIRSSQGRCNARPNTPCILAPWGQPSYSLANVVGVDGSTSPCISQTVFHRDKLFSQRAFFHHVHSTNRIHFQTFFRGKKKAQDTGNSNNPEPLARMRVSPHITPSGHNG